MPVEEQFKINFNQNLWGLVVCYLALGAAEYWCLKWLFPLSLIASIGMTLSVLISLVPYTVNYWRNKMKKGNKMEK